MDFEWTHRNLLVENVNEGITSIELESFFNSFQKVEQIQFVKDNFNGEDYFLHQVIITFEDIIKNPQLQDAAILDFKDTQFQIFLDLEERINFEFFIYGLNKNEKQKRLIDMFTKFRVDRIEMYPSSSNQFQFARLLFNKARDRDSALIRMEPIPSCGMYFFPDMKRVLPFKSEKLQNIKSTEKAYEIFFNSKSYKVSSANMGLISSNHNDQDSLKINTEGDVSTLISYINGNEIFVTQNNVCFLRLMGTLLQMDELVHISITTFLNFDNVVVFSNKSITQSQFKPFIDLVVPNYQRLTHNGRFRNIPANLSSQIIKNMKPPGLNQKQILKLLYQSTNRLDDKTSLVELLDLKQLPIADVIRIVQDPKIRIDRFKDDIIALMMKKVSIQQFLEIPFKVETPLKGVFSYILSRDNGNSQKSVLVEASSTNSGEVEEIINGEIKTTFCSKSSEGQWIKFKLVKDEVQPTNYVIQTHSDASRPYIKNWDLSGSKDGTNWVTLDSVKDCTGLAKPNSWIMRTIKCNEFYNMFKLSHTGINSLKYENIVISHIELFGSIRNYEPDTQ